jgi:hypothetical protein
MTSLPARHPLSSLPLLDEFDSQPLIAADSLVRTPPILPIDLTCRDRHLLKDLFDSRLLTLRQVAAIHFADRYPMAKKRIAKLRLAKLVGAKRVRIANTEQLFLFLTRRGFELIAGGLSVQYGDDLSFRALERRVSVAWRTMEHEHAVAEFKAAFVRAARTSETPLTIPTFQTWSRLIQFEAVRPVETGDYNFGTKLLTKPSLLQPDAFFRIRDGEADHHFYLEMDRSTEKHGTLLSKAIGYRDWLQSGGHARRFGFQRPEEVPFRVLVVLKSEERRNNFFDTLLHHPKPVKGLIWASTFDAVNRDPLGEHWMTPYDYHRALKGHPRFDPLLDNSPTVYKRRPEREELVARSSRCHELIPQSNAIFPPKTSANSTGGQSWLGRGRRLQPFLCHPSTDQSEQIRQNHLSPAPPKALTSPTIRAPLSPKIMESADFA